MPIIQNRYFYLLFTTGCIFVYLYYVKLYERYLHKTSEELVEVIEAKENFQPEIPKIALEILKERNLPHEQILKLSTDFQRARIVKMLNELDPLNDELTIPTSFFLGKEDIKELLRNEFEKFIQNKEGFRFDVWQYSIGGL